MRIKTFYAKTMAEALRQVKSTLGPDALLLSTKEIPRRSGVWGNSSGVEVVAAVDHSEDMDRFTRSGNGLHLSGIPVSGGESEPDFANPESGDVVVETYSRAGTVKSRASLVSKPSTAKAGSSRPGSEGPVDDSAGHATPFKGRVPAALYEDLVHCGVDGSLAEALLARALDSLTAGQRRSRAALIRAVSEAALDGMGDSGPSHGLPGKRIVAFFGPSGVGKTSSIAKLAAHLALQQKKKVVLMTTDGYRIGAIEQLRSYAGLMGIPFRFVGQAPELPKAIEENSQRDYILIDTAGLGPRDMESMRPLANFLRNSETAERHLLLSAGTKPSDMRATVERFEMWEPDHLLFTKLDETSTPGPILNELIRTRKAISYYTDGQRVPDDFHAVPRERIIDIVLHPNENLLKDRL